MFDAVKRACMSQPCQYAEITPPNIFPQLDIVRTLG